MAKSKADDYRAEVLRAEHERILGLLQQARAGLALIRRSTSLRQAMKTADEVFDATEPRSQPR